MNRSALAVSILILIAFVTGCNDDGAHRLTHGKGDVRQFILTQSLTLGGRPRQTNDLPPLTTEWSFQRDKIATVISLPREQFSAVDVFLRHVFGPPSNEPRDFPNGNRLGSYDTNAAGCAIFYSMSATNCVVALMKPVITLRDVGGHYWVAQIGNGKYGIHGNSRYSAIVIVQGSIVLPFPFWGLVTLVVFSALVIIAVPWLIFRRRANAA